ncbi:uncharacterized protein LOC124498089 isoform X2 [Dermatophagoides farinae]|uniref:uncharacterized protein LOC124498089 isoform X2 n=1 Tax=Dermatophagoides farinae TaxID=6954 RepID=UPI003F604C35
MLPIMTFEPIQINLRNCHQCSSSSSSSKTVANDNQSKTLTLYPITVEFNRLFRRQKQILKNENEMMMMSTTSTFECKTNVRPPNSNSLWVDNQLDASTTSDILQDCNDVNGLLYSTIIHYMTTTMFAKNNDNDNENVDDNEMKRNSETDLCRLNRILCMPGTRTLLLMANKQDVLDDHHHHHHRQQQQHCNDNSFDDGDNGNKGEDISDDQEMFDDLTIATVTAVDTFNELKSSSSQSPSQSPSSSSSLSTSMTIPMMNRLMKINSIFSYNNNHQQHSIINIGNNDNNDNDDDDYNNSSSTQSSNSVIMSNKTTARCRQSKRKSNNFLTNFEHYLNHCFECRKKFFDCTRHGTIMNDNDDNGDDYYKSLIGIEQQIYGAITFYKSYRLESLKILEIALIAVKCGHERSGIGTQLIKCLKDNCQIGPYDSMHVKIAGNNHRLRQFFLKNEFTDDIILNAGFDQLIIRPDESDDDHDDDDDNELDKQIQDDDDDDCNSIRTTKTTKSSLQHSISYYEQMNHYCSGKKRKREKNSNNSNNETIMISMCYLPPFSVGTLSESITNHRTLERMDGHFVDDMIDQAQMVWRRNLLASYRTQWSCVGRLRSEIGRLRQQLTKRDTIIDQLRRENFHLRNTLVHKKQHQHRIIIINYRNNC